MLASSRLRMRNNFKTYYQLRYIMFILIIIIKKNVRQVAYVILLSHISLLGKMSDKLLTRYYYHIYL